LSDEECSSNPSSQLKNPSQVFYGWRLVAITVLVLAAVVGPIFQGLGTFFVALERQFGWSRTLLSGAFALSRAEGALLGPLEGLLTDRLGSRRMVLIGLTLLGIGFIAFSLIQGVVSFYLAFLVMFAGAGLGGFLPLMTAINHWFVRRRTAAMAIGLTGVNLGGLLVPLLALTIVSFGWRLAALGIGITICALAIPISLAIRNRPEEYGLRPDGDPPINFSRIESSEASGSAISNEDENNSSFTVSEAVKTSAFWAITAAHSFSAISAVTIAVHIVPALTDIGMSLPLAGIVVTTYTLAGVFSQLVSGLLGDRLPKAPAIAVFIVIQGLGMLVAATVQTIPGAFLFAVLYGIGFGGRIPLLTSIRGDYFGRENFATIFGISQVPMNLASVIGPILAGYLFDHLGSYTVPFFGLGVLNGVGAILILLARKPVHRPHEMGSTDWTETGNSPEV
jgi:MFS family permease